MPNFTLPFKSSARHIRKYLIEEDAKTVASALIGACLNYCNSLLVMMISSTAFPNRTVISYSSYKTHWLLQWSLESTNVST